MEDLRRQVEELLARDADLERENAELRKQNTELRACNAELEAELKQRGKKYRPKPNAQKQTKKIPTSAAIANALIYHTGKCIEDVGWFWDHAARHTAVCVARGK